jgi:hypothetical protein
MEPIQDDAQCFAQMAIIEKYETVIAYCYPIAQNISRHHGVAKEMFIRSLLGQVALFTAAGKSIQVSRIYAADAGLSDLRFWFRFIAQPKIRGMTPHQHQVALTMLAEVGAMVGSWIKRMKRKGVNG